MTLADAVRRPVPLLVRFFAGASFPAFLLSVFAFATTLLALMLVVPVELSPSEQFALDFKTWCFGYDASDGSYQWAYAVGMLTSPMWLSAFTLLVWGPSLRQAWTEARRSLVAPVAAGAAVVLALSVAMGTLAPAGTAADAQLVFPADALRTDEPAPSFSLVDHTGAPVSLSALRGRVVVVTAVYASCGLACPMIFAQQKRALAALDPAARESVTVVAVTLDPEHDDVARLAALADAQGVRAPAFRLATGEPAAVNDALDRIGVARSRDPETGIIDHANLFLLVDRRGRVAFRLSLGDLQERWLADALRILAAEPGA